MHCLHSPENQEARGFSSHLMTKPGRERGGKWQRNIFGGKQGFQRKKGTLAEASGMPSHPRAGLRPHRGEFPQQTAEGRVQADVTGSMLSTNASRDPQLGHGRVRVPSQTEASTSPGFWCFWGRSGHLGGPDSLLYSGVWSSRCSLPGSKVALLPWVPEAQLQPACVHQAPLQREDVF